VPGLDVQVGDHEVADRTRFADRGEVGRQILLVAGGRGLGDVGDTKAPDRVVQARRVNHEFGPIADDPHPQAIHDLRQLTRGLRRDHVHVTQGVHPRTADGVGTCGTGTGERGKGRGRRDERNPPDRGLSARCGQRGRKVTTSPGVRQAGGVQGGERREEPAVGVVERMIGRGRHQVDA
jgi:hypothetical protein